MASVQKRGKAWVAEVRIKGQYASKSFDTKTRALQWSAKKELEFRGEVNQIALVSDLFDRYAREISPKKKGGRWEIIRLNKLKSYDLAFKLVKDVLPEDIVKFRDIRLAEVSPSSVKREMTLMQSTFEIARKEWKWIEVNPFKDVSKPKSPPGRDRRISDTEIDRILKALMYDGTQVVHRHGEVAVAFLFAIETGMRQGEIWGLRGDDLFLSERYLTLRDTKNGYNRNVPLSKRAIALIEQLSPTPGRKVFKYPQATAGQIFRRAVQLAGIEDLRFHDTRHEALTRLARKLDMLDLARMIGHRDPRSLMVYYNPTAQEIAHRLD